MINPRGQGGERLPAEGSEFRYQVKSRRTPTGIIVEAIGIPPNPDLEVWIDLWPTGWCVQETGDGWSGMVAEGLLSRIDAIDFVMRNVMEEGRTGKIDFMPASFLSVVQDVASPENVTFSASSSAIHVVSQAHRGRWAARGPSPSTVLLLENGPDGWGVRITAPGCEPKWLAYPLPGLNLAVKILINAVGEGWGRGIIYAAHFDILAPGDVPLCAEAE